MKLLHVVTCIILSMCTSCNLLIALFDTMHVSEMKEERPCIINYFSMILRESINSRQHVWVNLLTWDTLGKVRRNLGLVTLITYDGVSDTLK